MKSRLFAELGELPRAMDGCCIQRVTRQAGLLLLRGVEYRAETHSLPRVARQRFAPHTTTRHDRGGQRRRHGAGTSVRARGRARTYGPLDGKRTKEAVLLIGGSV